MISHSAGLFELGFDHQANRDVQHLVDFQEPGSALPVYLPVVVADAAAPSVARGADLRADVETGHLDRQSLSNVIRTRLLRLVLLQQPPAILDSDALRLCRSCCVLWEATDRQPCNLNVERAVG